MANLIPHFIRDKYKKGIYRGNFSATVMFADISGFTALTEALAEYGKEGCEILSNIINEVFTPCIRIIYENGGFIANFAGDSWTAVFTGEASEALIASWETIEEVKRQKIKSTRFGDYRISVKIGLSYGDVDWGIVGTRDRKTYYFRGEAVKGSAMSEKRCRGMDIVMDDSCRFDSRASLREIEEGYFRLEDIALSDKGREIILVEYDETVPEVFLSEGIDDRISAGELRDIVSVFISFRDIDDFRDLDDFAGNLFRVIDESGGYFSRIGFGDKGGTVLVNFGMPFSYEDNIERALNCIYSIRGIYKDKLRAGVSFGRLFSGIIGSSTRSAYDVLGDAVNVSARIAMKAPWGRIWIAGNIEETAGAYFDLDYVNEFSFKGKSIKIRIYDLKKRSQRDASYKGSFYGREGELKELDGFLKVFIEEKSPGIQYIYGTAGIGKSRLIDKALDSCEGINICCLQCDGILRKSLNPFIYYLEELFEQNAEISIKEKEIRFEKNFIYLTENAEEDIKKELCRTKSFLRALLSLDVKGTLFEQVDAKGKYMNTLFAVWEVFKALSVKRPTVIKLEDIHWIDPDSIALLKHMTRNINRYPVAVICTARFNDDGSKPRLDTGSKVRTGDVILGSVDEKASVEIIREKLGNYPDDNLYEFIKERTSCNPFYIEQFCLYLRENSLVYPKDNKYSISQETDSIPSKINQILIARIDRLSADIKELVKIASVMGKEFNRDILLNVVKRLNQLIDVYEKRKFDIRAIDRIVQSDTVSFISEAQKANIWDKYDEIRYIFRHSLLQESVYDMQLRGRLRVIHRIIAQILEDINSEEFCIDLAYHYERAEIPGKTAEYLEKAGNWLQKSYKNMEAVKAYEKLLNYLNEPEKIIQIRLLLGDIYKLTGEWDKAENIFRECCKKAEEIENSEILAQVLDRYGSLYSRKGMLKESLIFLQKSCSLYDKTGNKQGLMKVHADLGFVFLDMGDYDNAMKHYNITGELAEQADDMQGRVVVYYGAGAIYYEKGEYSRALDNFNKSMNICKRNGLKSSEGNAIGNIGNLYLNMGDLDEALKYYKMAKEIFAETGEKPKAGTAVFNIGIINFIKLNFEEALDAFRFYMRISEEMGYSSGIAGAALKIGDVYAEMGDYEHAIDQYNLSMNICEETGNKSGIIGAGISIGCCFMTKLDYRKASLHFEKAKVIAEEIGNRRDVGKIFSNMGKNYFNQGLYSDALECFHTSLDIAEDIGDKMGILISKGNIGRIYFELHDFNKSLAHIDDALELFEKINCLHINKAEWLLVKSKILLDKGKLQDALECAENACNTSSALKDTEYAVRARVQKLVINADHDKEGSIKGLCRILSEEMDEELKAEIYSELYILDSRDEYRAKALEIYESAYKARPLYYLKDRIDKLRK